jgi:Tfp pilus assembly protein PilF
LRGLAFLKTGEGAQAAAEFQKVLNNRGIVDNTIVGPLAQLGLARAYALSGSNAKARAAYNEFFTLWKEADPEVPVLRQARSDYAKLR